MTPRRLSLLGRTAAICMAVFAVAWMLKGCPTVATSLTTPVASVILPV